MNCRYVHLFLVPDVELVKRLTPAGKWRSVHWFGKQGKHCFD